MGGAGLEHQGRILLTRPPLVGFLFVLFLCLAAPPLPLLAQSSPSYDGKTVGTVLIEGNRRITEGAIRVSLKTRAGQPLSRSVLDDDVKRLYELGFFKVEAFVEEAPSGLRVRFVLGENPRIASVGYAGLSNLVKAELDDVVNLKKGQFISDLVLRLVTRDVEKLYQERGYLFAEVKVLRDGTPEGIDVTIRVIEGPKVLVKDIKIVGNRHLSGKQIRKVMRTKLSTWLSRKALNRDQLEEDIVAIRNLYRAEGFLDVSVDLGDLWYNQARNRVSITILVEERERFELGEVRFAGNELFTDEELRAEIDLKTGDPFLEAELNFAVRRIQLMYGKEAYIDARVRPEFLLDESTSTIGDLQFRIDEGRKIYVGKIEMVGNRLTKDKVIRREISLSPGDPVDFEEVRRSFNRLNDSGYFVQGPGGVDIRAVDVESETRDYLVEVKEGQTGLIRFALGVGSNSGVIGDISLLKRNFDITDLPEGLVDLLSGDAFTGAGQSLTLQISPGSELSRYGISFRDPFIFDTKNSFQAEVFRRVRLRFEYDESREGARLNLGRYLSRFNPDLSVDFQIRAEQVQLDNFERNAPQDAFDYQGDTNVIGIGPTLSYRQLDAINFPTKGFRADLSYELVGGFLGGDVDMHRVSAETRGFFPVLEDAWGRRHVMSLWSRAGWSEAVRNTDRVPIFERFFAGGRDSIRGFDFRGVGPHQNGEPVGGDVMLVGGVEYEFPLYQEMLRGNFFIDAGTVSESVHTDDFRHFRAAAGFGFRLKIPFLGPVPFALDFGFPFFRQNEDDRQVVSFSLGSPLFGF